MKAYPEYKTSGIDWLGTIPKHWDCVKTAWLFDQIGSGSTPTSGEDAFYKDGTVNWLQTGDLNDGIITETSKKVTEYAIETKGLRLYPKGSLVIAMYGATIAKLGLLDIDTTVNQACCVLVKSKKVNSNFIFYFFQVAKKELISLASGGGQPNISQSTIYDFKVPVPPLVEQEAIAAYLDDMTGKIDKLLAEKQKQVADLRSYRTSLITETVTRGLNPNAPLRPSGIDWLGDIPEHWKVIKMKHCVDISNGSDPKTEGNIPVYGSGATSFKTCGEYKYGPTVLIGRKGATLHIPHWIEGKYWNVDTAFDTRVKSNYSLRFFYYIACSFDYEQYKSQTTLPSMTQSAYENAFIPVPPIAEQQQIAGYLDEKTAKIDTLIEELVAQLNDLAIYKQAVINEAVTGKVDVRDWISKS